MTTSPSTENALSGVGRTHDVRSYWRVALAVAAPLPWAAMGLVNILQPFAGDESFVSTVAKVRDHLGLVLTASWISLPFFAFLIPSALAVVAATRRHAPRLAAWGGTLTVVGFGLGFGGLGGGGTPLAVVTVIHGFDVDTMARVDAAFQAAPYALVAGLFWVTALIVGQALLGLALWRSRLVSVLFPIALLLGGPTHPFVPGSHIAVGIGLLVAAVGYAGASLALIRTDNDDFDLPPVRHGHGERL
jgi:hypothetical protein